MLSKNGVIQGFKKSLGEATILTDAEDLYVYSFEQFFKSRKYPKLDAVARLTSNEQERRIFELAKKEGVKVLRRSEEKREAHETKAAFHFLVDDAPMPQLETLNEEKARESQGSDFEKEILRGGDGSLRNFSLALKSFFSSLPLHKCFTCNVCSGYCTVASSFNGVETWSSKGRTLLTRALVSGEIGPSSKLTDVMYTCSLCGLCFAQCFETTQVRKAIMEARHRLAQEKHAPDLFKAASKNIFDIGDPSGMPPSKRVIWTRQLEQEVKLPKNCDVIYWAGCVTSTRTPKVAKAFGNVLNRAQVDFAFLGEKEGCCGYVFVAAGLWDEAKENAVKLVERVKDTKAETLVTPCSGCYYTFSRLYPEILDVELPCKVMHSTQFVENLIKDQKIMPHSLNMEVTYHDPCSLGRHSNVYNSPRNVLKAVPNLDLVEMQLNRNRARCCGAGGGLWSFNNSVALNSATERLARDVAPLGVTALVTACPTCHLNFRYASIKKRMNTRIYDIMEIVESATNQSKVQQTVSS